MLYHGIIEPQKSNILTIVGDIITNIHELSTMDDINKVNIETTGLSISTLDYTKSGVILPNTKGITSLSQVLQVIKDKNNIEGNVIIHSFESDRKTIHL